jgi:hypothetical protein
MREWLSGPTLSLRLPPDAPDSCWHHTEQEYLRRATRLVARAAGVMSLATITFVHRILIEFGSKSALHRVFKGYSPTVREPQHQETINESCLDPLLDQCDLFFGAT